MLSDSPWHNISKHDHNVHVVFNVYKCSERHVYNIPIVFIVYKCFKLRDIHVMFHGYKCSKKHVYSHGTCVKVQNGEHWRSSCRGQLRFSLCSGATITRCWFQFISYLLVLVQLSWCSPMPHASCLASQGVVAACSSCSSCVGLLRSTAMLLCQLVCCFGLLQPLIQHIFYSACWHSLSALCMLG